MNLQMKSRNHYNPPPPCVCGKVCPCHDPKPYDSSGDWLLIVALLFPFVLFGMVVWFISTKEAGATKHIEVNGRDCIVVYHQDSITSTGSGIGHEVAQCPK